LWKTAPLLESGKSWNHRSGRLDTWWPQPGHFRFEFKNIHTTRMTIHAVPALANEEGLQSETIAITPSAAMGAE
jgi:hypothetical protein